MKATGIVRRIDDLGRVVIPKEVRRTMGIREGDPLEIFVDRQSGGITFVPYHSDASENLRAIAENIEATSTSPERLKIAEGIKKLAKKLEKID